MGFSFAEATFGDIFGLKPVPVTLLVGEFNRLEDSMKGNNTWEIVDGEWTITE